MRIGVKEGTLTFEAFDRMEDETSVRVAYRDNDFTGSVVFCDELYCIPEGGRPPQFFHWLANNWRGWEGEKTWTDVSYCFSVSATHDGTGHVTLKTRLRKQFGVGPDSELAGEVIIEPGQLDAIAAGMSALFERGWHPEKGKVILPPAAP